MPENELVQYIRTVCREHRVNVRQVDNKQYHDIYLTPIGRMWAPKHVNDFDLDERRIIWPRKDAWCEQCARQVFEKYIAGGFIDRTTNPDRTIDPDEEDF